MQIHFIFIFKTFGSQLICSHGLLAATSHFISDFGLECLSCLINTAGGQRYFLTFSVSLPLTLSPDEQHYPWNAYLVSIFSRLLPHFQLSHHFPPVTTCPFNVNLSPFSQAPHSYRVSPPPPHLPPTADCQKNNFLFSPDSLLSFSCLLFVSRALLRVGMGGGEVAKLRQMFISHPAQDGWAQIYYRTNVAK